MKIINFVGLLLLTLGLGSCYEDKGSYDYKEINQPVVGKGLEKFYDIGLGDTLAIKPEITWPLADGGEEINYEWKIDGKVVATTKDLFISQYSGETGKAYGTFNIIDKLAGMTYMNTFIIQVSPTYNKGWLILSERNGISELSYIRTKFVTEEGETKEVYEEFVDVYGKNTGETLGKGPKKLVEHWCDDYGRMGQVLVVNQDNSIELDGEAMTKVVDTRQEFIGEKYPEHFHPVDAMYAFNHSFLLNNDGKVYSRICEDGKNFQTGFYNQEPVYVSDSLSVKQLIPSLFPVTYSLLMYDQYNRRFLWVNCYAYQQGLISPVSYVGYQPGFTDLGNLGDKDLVYCGYYKSNDFATSGYINILKSDAGEYYIQDFLLYTFMTARVTDKYEKLFPEGHLIRPDTDFSVLPRRLYVFFTSGDALYYYDRATQTVGNPYVSFDGVKITSIHYDKGNEQLAVGLENGKFYIYDITDKALAAAEPQLIYAGKSDFGKIVDVIYKYGTMMNGLY